jgi:ribonucleoside-diphosphate reductase alpha chain
MANCVLIDMGDSMPSIEATVNSVLKYVVLGAGIGINGGRIRPINSKVRNGAINHSGVTPFYRLLESAINSCSQGGVRKGSATVHFTIWHPEILTLLQLRNAAALEVDKVRDLNYSIQVNKYLWKKLLTEEDFTLLSPHNTGDLYDSFFKDQEKFKELYEFYSNHPQLTDKIVVKSETILSLIAKHVFGTSNYYFNFVDNMNLLSSYNEKLAPIFMSNLCQEITQPTSPINHDGNEGLVATCTLSAQNFGKVGKIIDKTLDERKKILIDVFEETCETIVEILDNILDIQVYPIKQSEKFTMLYRNLGIGGNNLAYLLAKNGLSFDSVEAHQLVHNVMEAFQYYLLKASCKLAKEKGKAPGFNNTKYAKGLLPIDWYIKTLDNFVSKEDQTLLFDWEELRKEIKEYGLRNCTLSSFMPGETSSQIINSTSGCEPIRDVVSTKMSGSSHHTQVAPEADILDYKTFRELESNRNLIIIYGILQKFTDQSISVNLMYSIKSNLRDLILNNSTENNELIVKNLKASELFNDLTLAQLVGLKNIYYINIETDQSDNVKEEVCEFCVV